VSLQRAATRAIAAAIASLASIGPLAAQHGPRVTGYETYAVVAPVADEAQALPFAEGRCAKYDRFARFRWMEGSKAVFDCTLQKAERRPRPPAGGIY
jgi:hypothetical protein